MEINSLALKTDLIFHQFNGIVLNYNDYLVIKTPGNPTFFWGNLIYFAHPPATESLKMWKDIFREHFLSMNVQHMTFAWDGAEDDLKNIAPFLEDGFEIEKSVVMMTSEILVPKKINNDFRVRPIVSDQDWKQVLENHVLCRGEHFVESRYRKFAENRIENYRTMINAKKGLWMGAFLGDKVVGDLGIFFDQGIGRFQAVGTNPDFRRIGVCSTLIYQTLLMAREKMNISKFVIVADPDYHASQIYRSVGFKDFEIQFGLIKYNKNIWAK